MEIKDLAGLSKPLNKLISVVAQGVGAVAKPYLTRRNADAEAYRIRTIASATHDARKLLGKVDYANQEITITSPQDAADEEIMLLAERAESREQYQKLREQSNVEQITGYAAQELEDAQEVSEEPVDPDWIAGFFDMGKHISNEDMQFLWGKILAGEVKQPNSYSLRTLEVLKNLSRREAEIFQRVAILAIHPAKDDRSFILNPERGNYLEETFGLKFTDFLLLNEVGLLVNDLVQKFKGTKTYYLYSDKIITFERPSAEPEVVFQIKRFTSVGEELLSLMDAPSNLEYIQKFSSLLKQDESSIIKYATITGRDDQQIHHTELEEVK